ncbi:MAG: molybdopterin-dependent oxidoreductase [Proteobacteria bacterium]|nr:molybdopterin-dependent oxidoreductase [Pseudomonadota bacterium]
MKASPTFLESQMSPPHDSSKTHVSGASEFVDDRPMLKGELHCGVVYSRNAHARIINLDVSLALEIPGVVCAVTAKDVHHNAWGPIFQDQPIIAEHTVTFAGEVVAVLGATTPESLRRGLKAVRIDYEQLPKVMSIDDAILQKSFIGSERSISTGDVAAAMKSSPKTLSGKIKLAGADHFYLESNACVAYPRENGQIEVHSSTQHPTETQHVVAEACGLKFSDVVCIVKRLGGGFGGKESQAAPIAAYAALIAKKSNRPARLVLSKDDDMVMTGKRNPFQIMYTCGFNDDGSIMALDARLYSDGGAWADLSTAIMERAMLHCDNAYFIPNMQVRGQVCRTNHHPHTAFRGFGGPKGVAMIESIMEDVGRVLGMDALDIRKLNCYQPGKDLTHYGQTVENNVLPTLFNSLERSSNYRQRRQEIAKWNQVSSNNPRGLSLTAVKFGISFTTRFLNQGNALVNLHRDGTVQLSTGAVEMGQGVNQRIAMLVAEEFGVSLHDIRVMTTSTEKNANTSPTAASSGTDLNGAAALKAARKICGRLVELAIKLQQVPPEKWASRTAGLGTAPEIVLSHPEPEANAITPSPLSKTLSQALSNLKITFRDLVNEAYLNRISLSEYAHYRIENLGFNKLSGTGQAFLYFTQGVAASEVELNRDTGEVKVRRVDILMDLGRPINPGLDIGQVTGGFIQGMGWMTTENLVYNAEGFLLSHSPSTYKIPSVQDTPREFNVKLIENNDNAVNIRGTKAAGEPPLLLAVSVWTAVRDAIISSRKELVSLQVPATSEAVLRTLMPGAFAQFEQGCTP